MAREITSHKVPGLNELIHIMADDEPGSGGANHRYCVCTHLPGIPWLEDLNIKFQDGSVSEFGQNGYTNEALIAVVIDRLQGFQKGPYACRENAIALTKLEEAMHWLHHRTNERLRRGVEGTSQK